jgi:hypothetical protein
MSCLTCVNCVLVGRIHECKAHERRLILDDPNGSCCDLFYAKEEKMPEPTVADVLWNIRVETGRMQNQVWKLIGNDLDNPSLEKLYAALTNAKFAALDAYLAVLKGE